MAHLEGNHHLIQVDDLAKLQHMVGANGRTPGFRNYYNASDEDVPAMMRLTDAGLAENTHGYYWRATLLGCKAAGLSKAATCRALDV